MRSWPPFFSRFPLVRSAALAALFLTPGGPGLIPPGRAQVDDGSAEILTRGPIHEAFAATISFNSIPGVLVPKAAPAAIEEIPPEQRPEGGNILWIPGYWAWDEEAMVFLWVSGIWRNVPPGRQWIPGYWAESGQDYQWISGYWADATAAEVEYLDQPPESLEAGPNVESPSRNHVWIPGTWLWRTSRYQWQGGYWDEPQADWVWIPPYYNMTPRGYIHVDGYYDYDFDRRGMVFAPVRFQGDGYSRSDYRYRPSTVISLTALIDHLFLRPRSRHYYFGDYYAAPYRESGYYSSSSYYSGGHGYDPIYAHQRWTHRNDDGWQRRSEETYRYYRDHEDARPPRTLTALTAFMGRPDRDRRLETEYATRIDQYVARKDSKIKFRPVDGTEQQRFAQRGQAIREFGDERRKEGGRSEGAPDQGKPDKNGGQPNNGKGGPVKVKLPRSPIVAQPKENRDQGDIPPARVKGGGSEGKRGEGKSKEPQDPKGDRRPTDEQPGGKSKPDREREGGPDPQPKRESPDSKRDGPPRDAKPMPKIKPNERAQDLPEPKPREQTKEMPAPRGKGSEPPGADRKDTPRKESGESRPPEPKDRPKVRPEVSPDRKSSSGSGKGGNRESSASPRPQPRPEPNAEPKRAPKAEPRQKEPKPGPRAEPKRAPKEEPRREAPKPEPKPEPKREPKTQPPPKAASPEAAPPGKKEENPDGKPEKNKKGKG